MGKLFERAASDDNRYNSREVRHLENISLNEERSAQEINMSVSPICQKDGRKVAYVSFTDGGRMAEGEIPDCRITKSKNFGKTEIEQLENYMRDNLVMIKRMAASVNPLDAFLGKRR